MKGHKKIIISKMDKGDSIILNRGTLYVLYQKYISEKNSKALQIIRQALERLHQQEELHKELTPFWGISIPLADIDELYFQRTSIPEHAYTIPNEYYQKIYQTLTEEEKIEIRLSIKKKSCKNCHNQMCEATADEKLSFDSDGFPKGSFCESWNNEVMMGEYHALRMRKTLM